MVISISYQLARVQTLDSPPGQDDSLLRNSSLCDMLNEMATHSRRIQVRIALEAPRPRTTARTFVPETLSLPTQESIIHSLYATPASSPDYYDHRFPRNALRSRQRSSSTRYPPPPVYSETDPNASTSVTLSDMGLCVRSGIAPQLPPPYSSRPGSPTPGDG